MRTSDTRPIGAFGQNMAIAGDIVWLPGHGLYGSMMNGPCSPGCIATIDPSTGHATVLTTSAPYDLYALTAFGGTLHALAGSGNVYAIDPITGATTLQFNLLGIDFWDAI